MLPKDQKNINVLRNDVTNHLMSTTMVCLRIAIRRMEMFEHQGNHIDAPLHFSNGGQDLTQIPPERLYGPGVVIDVREKATMNRDYAVTVDDLKGK